VVIPLISDFQVVMLLSVTARSRQSSDRQLIGSWRLRLILWQGFGRVEDAGDVVAGIDRRIVGFENLRKRCRSVTAVPGKPG
jgi:hypothetical protein